MFLLRNLQASFLFQWKVSRFDSKMMWSCQQFRNRWNVSNSKRRKSWSFQIKRDRKRGVCARPGTCMIKSTIANGYLYSTTVVFTTTCYFAPSRDQQQLVGIQLRPAQVHMSSDGKNGSRPIVDKTALAGVQSRWRRYQVIRSPLHCLKVMRACAVWLKFYWINHQSDESRGCLALTLGLVGPEFIRHSLSACSAGGHVAAAGFHSKHGLIEAWGWLIPGTVNIWQKWASELQQRKNTAPSLVQLVSQHDVLC